MTADDREHETDHVHARESDGAPVGRRRLLAGAGAALSGALASAGCLTNPWGPDAPGADESTTQAAVDATVTTDSGATSPPDATTTAGGESTTAESNTAESTTATDVTVETSEATETATPTTTEPTTTAVPPAERDPDLVVAVAPDGFQFEPSSFTVDAGDVVRWEWRASGHNVQVRSKPDGSDWTGTGAASETFAEGHVHAHVFKTPGDYVFFCAPHQSLGMTGSFTVR